MTEIKKTLKNTPIYTFGDFLQRGSSFLVLPFLTYFLSPEELGRAIVYVTIAAFLSGFLTLNIVSSIIRFATDKISDYNYLHRLFSTISVFLLFGTIFLNLIFISIFVFFNYFFLGLDYLAPILTIFLATIITPYDVYQRILISLESPKTYIRNQFLNFSIYTSSLFILIFLNFSYLSILYSTIISYFFFYILMIFEIKMKFNKSYLIDLDLLKKILKYSIRLIPNRFFILLPNLLDRIVISLISISSAAIYSIGYRIGEASSYLSSGFLKIYPRWLYIALNDYQKNKDKIHKLYIIILFISFNIACALTIIAEDIVNTILDERYAESWVIVPLISFSVAFNNLRTFWINFIMYNKDKAYFATYPTVTFCLVSCTLMFLSYETLGILGIGGSILIASILSFVVTLIFVKKIGYETFNLKYMFLSIMMMVFSFYVYKIKPDFVLKFLLITVLAFFTIFCIKKLMNLDYEYDQKEF